VNLDATTVVIRPRSPSEAVDLGYRLARAWWRPIYAVWFTMVAPVWALAYAVGYRKPWIAAIVLWWLRPLFDRAVLHVVSHAVFGDCGAGSSSRRSSSTASTRRAPSTNRCASSKAAPRRARRASGRSTARV